MSWRWGHQGWNLDVDEKRPGSIDGRERHTPPFMRRVDASLVAAVIIHIVIAIAFLDALGSQRYFAWFAGITPRTDAPGEAVRWVTVSPAPAESPSDTTSGPRRVIEPAVSPLVRDPSNDPSPAVSSTRIESATGTTADSNGGATGNPDGRADVVLVPSSADPRIWGVRSPVGMAAPTHTKILESSLGRGIRESNDSIAALGVQTVRPDWVSTRGGGSYGVDNARIRLGPVSIPAVALGLLPIPGFGCMPTMHFPDRPVRDSIGITCLRLENPTVAERNERITEMSAEIRARAPLAVTRRAEIERINARNDRARIARLRASTGAGTASPPP